MPADFDQPIHRINPPPKGREESRDEPPCRSAFDPTADPVWGPAFTQERPPRGYRVRPEAVWLKARDAYLGGLSAEAVCDAFDLGLSAFRQRARREGWRRSDAGEADLEPIGMPPEPEGAPPTAELADLAWRQAAQAIRRGRVYEARAWMRAAAELKALVRAEANAAYLAAYDAEKAAKGAASAGADVDPDEGNGEETEDAAEGGLHGLHGDFRVQSAGAGAKDRPPLPPEVAAALKRTRRIIASLPGAKPP